MVWANEIMEDFIEWFKTSPKAAEYQHLDWSVEIERSKSVAMDEFTGLS